MCHTRGPTPARGPKGRPQRSCSEDRTPLFKYTSPPIRAGTVPNPKVVLRKWLSGPPGPPGGWGAKSKNEQQPKTQVDDSSNRFAVRTLFRKSFKRRPLDEGILDGEVLLVVIVLRI